MIIVRLTGGLGNQMFQYAAGRFLAEKNRTILKLDTSAYKREYVGLRTYKLNIFNIRENIATPEETESLTTGKQSYLKTVFNSLHKGSHTFLSSYIVEKHFHFDPEILLLPDNVYLAGYWQSEKYFKCIEDIIRKEFTFSSIPEGPNKMIYDLIENCDSVSLHIRRGDYASNPTVNRIHEVCDIAYFENCINYIGQRINRPHFFLFSDDIEWSRENLRIAYETTIVDQNDQTKDYEDLRLMSRCKHHILSNSSFSWWGAWLNASPGKMVLAPQRWFKTDCYDTRDLYLKNWIRIGHDDVSLSRVGTVPLHFQKGLLKLSIVVATYNRQDILSKCLDSLTKQSLDKSQYEVIIVDNNSTDATRSIAERYVHTNENFRLYSESEQGCAAARNRGWREARGEYVAFIDDDAKAGLDWAKKIVNAFETRTPKPVVVGGQAFPWYEKVPPEWFTDDFEVRTWGKHAHYLSPPRIYFSGMNMAIQKALLEKYGGFIPELGTRYGKPSMGEDAEFFHRIYNDNPYFWYDPDIIIAHWTPVSRTKISYRFQRAFECGKAMAYIEGRKGIPARNLAGVIRFAILLPLKLFHTDGNKVTEFVMRIQDLGYRLGVLWGNTKNIFAGSVRKYRSMQSL